jgi:ribosomal 50S subunit-associated protein YjgA (DUF615 family)
MRPAPLPTLEELRRHLIAFGPEGIVEAATHLPDDERSQLETEVRAARKAQRFSKRRRQS